MFTEVTFGLRGSSKAEVLAGLRARLCGDGISESVADVVVAAIGESEIVRVEFGDASLPKSGEMQRRALLPGQMFNKKFYFNGKKSALWLAASAMGLMKFGPAGLVPLIKFLFSSPFSALDFEGGLACNCITASEAGVAVSVDDIRATTVNKACCRKGVECMYATDGLCNISREQILKNVAVLEDRKIFTDLGGRYVVQI